jgi:hypothetical protein
MTGVLSSGPSGLSQYEGILLTVSHVTGTFNIGDSIYQTVPTTTYSHGNIVPSTKIVNGKIDNIVGANLNISYSDGNFIVTVDTNSILYKLDNSATANIDSISTNTYTNVATLSVGNSSVKSTNVAVTNTGTQPPGITNPTSTSKTIEETTTLIANAIQVIYSNTYINATGTFITNNYVKVEAKDIILKYSNTSFNQTLTINTSAISLSNVTTTYNFISPTDAQITSGNYYLDSNNTWSPVPRTGTVSVGVANQVAYYSAAGNTISGTSVLTIYGSNVGINNTTPTHALHVNGFISSNGSVSRGGTAGDFTENYFNLFWNGSNPHLYVDTTDLGRISFTSDYRLKSNIVSQNTAIERVMNLRPVSYQTVDIHIFKGSDEIQEGFIAHELKEIIPSAVNYDKDAVDNEGNMQPQTINPLPIIAVLTKAIQDLKEEFEEYKKSHP